MGIHQDQYAEGSIRVLKGLEPVKQRPGMYTKTDSPLHLIQEVIDNATDEALGGHGSLIGVILHSDGSISVEDHGRGIPLGKHPDEHVDVIELVFTRLHAGGKFNKSTDGAYRFSGGLHGVGVSVTNALSTRLEVTVARDKKIGHIVFAHGDVLQPLVIRAQTKSDKKQGSLVRVWPDPQYFESSDLPISDLKHLLQSKALLLKGVTVQLDIEKTAEQFIWQFNEGLDGFLRQTLDQEFLLAPVFSGDCNVSSLSFNEEFARGEGCHWALAFTTEGAVVRESYVNLIPTPSGGTHEFGLREAVFQSVKTFCELHGILPKGVKLVAEDIFSRASFVLSAKVLDPQFQGQIKEKLNSRSAVKLVSALIRPAFEIWLNQHFDEGKKIAELAIRQAQARTKATQKVEKRKSSSVVVLPGKLTDCESTDLTRNEVYLVEGDSAGGSAKMGRDKEFQAVLPLRGKVLNAWEVDKDRLFANQEIHDISVAIGVDPHCVGDAVDLSGLRYGKICILSDADVDGSHIQVLLLTLFYKHFPLLIQQRYVYLARPPLFRVDVPAQGKRPARKLYCLNEDELRSTEEKLVHEGIKTTALKISRFKGLGEMNAEQLWDTTLNPDTRHLLPVTLGALSLLETNQLMSLLMARGESQSRRAWLEEKGSLVDVDV